MYKRTLVKLCVCQREKYDLQRRHFQRPSNLFDSMKDGENSHLPLL